jgi:DNA repair exonuclease SbcCD nuclease subunit
MTTLVTGDLHLSENPRDQYRFKFMDWLVQTVRDRPISTLIIVGDLTEEKDRHSAWLVNEICRYIHKLSKYAHVWVLKGNHDYLVSDNPFFQFLGRIENITWINEPTKFPPGSLFLPHTRQHEKDWAGWLDTGYEYIFCHNSFEGAMDNGHALKGIPLTVFPKGSKIISGDIHTPQTIGPLTYVGAPYSVKFGDSYAGRVLLRDGSKITSLPYDGPQKRLFEIYDTKELKNLDARKGDLIKLRINLKSDQYDDWPNIRQTIRDWAAEHGYDLTLAPVMERKPRTYKQIDIKSDEQLIRSFAKRTDMSKSVLASGLEFLE